MLGTQSFSLSHACDMLITSFLMQIHIICKYTPCKLSTSFCLLFDGGGEKKALSELGQSFKAATAHI